MTARTALLQWISCRTHVCALPRPTNQLPCPVLPIPYCAVLPCTAGSSATTRSRLRSVWGSTLASTLSSGTMGQGGRGTLGTAGCERGCVRACAWVGCELCCEVVVLALVCCVLVRMALSDEAWCGEPDGPVSYVVCGRE